MPGCQGARVPETKTLTIISCYYLFFKVIKLRRIRTSSVLSILKDIKALLKSGNSLGETPILRRMAKNYPKNLINNNDLVVILLINLRFFGGLFFPKRDTHTVMPPPSPSPVVGPSFFREFLKSRSRAPPLEAKQQ